MASPLDARTTESKARELLDNRIDSVRTLVTTRQTLHDLREQIATAETDDVKAYRAALSDGWTPDELRKLGLDQPDKMQRVRRRAASRKPTHPESASTPRAVVTDGAAG